MWTETNYIIYHFIFQDFYDSNVIGLYLENIGVIEKKAFGGCEFIFDITISGNIGDIEENAFHNYIYGRTDIIIDGKKSVEDVPNWILRDGTRVKDHDLSNSPIKGIFSLLKGNTQ